MKLLIIRLGHIYNSADNRFRRSLAQRTIRIIVCLVGLVVFSLSAGPVFDYIYNQTTPPTSPRYHELPTPRPTLLDDSTGKVLAAQLDRADQYKYLTQTMNDWDLHCFTQARVALQGYKHQPGAFDHYVASLWQCAYTGKLDN